MILVSHNPEAGLFSQINFVITHIDHAEHADFRVDWKEGLVYCDSSAGNLFDRLFHQLSPPRPDSQRCSTWPHLRYTSINAASLYLGKPDWRTRLNRCWKSLVVRSELQDEVDNFWSACGGKIETAMHIRNRTIGQECPGGNAPTLADYEEALRGHSGTVFLATDNVEAASHFRDLLGEGLVCRDIGRSPDMQTEYHRCLPQSARDAQNCLIDALIMAKCNHLIHSVSNIATAVLYINPQMTHTFVRHSGLSASDTNLISSTLTTCEPENLIHVDHPSWCDWILLYRNYVFSRHSIAHETGIWERPTPETIRLRWSNWGVETFRLLDEAGPISTRNAVNTINTLRYRCLDSQ